MESILIERRKILFLEQDLQDVENIITRPVSIDYIGKFHMVTGTYIKKKFRRKSILQYNKNSDLKRAAENTYTWFIENKIFDNNSLLSSPKYNYEFTHIVFKLLTIENSDLSNSKLTKCFNYLVNLSLRMMEISDNVELTKMYFHCIAVCVKMKVLGKLNSDYNYDDFFSLINNFLIAFIKNNCGNYILAVMTINATATGEIKSKFNTELYSNFNKICQLTSDLLDVIENHILLELGTVYINEEENTYYFGEDLSPMAKELVTNLIKMCGSNYRFKYIKESYEKKFNALYIQKQKEIKSLNNNIDLCLDSFKKQKMFVIYTAKDDYEQEDNLGLGVDQSHERAQVLQTSHIDILTKITKITEITNKNYKRIKKSILDLPNNNNKIICINNLLEKCITFFKNKFSLYYTYNSIASEYNKAFLDAITLSTEYKFENKKQSQEWLEKQNFKLPSLTQIKALNGHILHINSDDCRQLQQVTAIIVALFVIFYDTIDEIKSEAAIKVHEGSVANVRQAIYKMDEFNSACVNLTTIINNMLTFRKQLFMRLHFYNTSSSSSPNTCIADLKKSIPPSSDAPINLIFATSNQQIPIIKSRAEKIKT